MTETSADHTNASGLARRVRAAIWVVLAAMVVAGVTWYFVMAGQSQAHDVQPAAAAQVVRADSHRLTAPMEEKAQLVEFLDFECEACRGAIPLIESLKAEYGDRITFVHRYYPLAGHRNSVTSALAVEAAAQQGKYQAMADRLFETQPQWGEGSESKAPQFRTYAQELGLDLAAYDAAVASDATRQRVEQDIADGKALGVTGTPTFFLDGKKLRLDTEAQFRQLLDDAVR
ncbi:thioredoxin domain-containing protein [Pseudarthrobacter sp. MEB009]|uniref:DsbA family protein n=1 Tax=Pseudarthrobacter sp. MEB009 TaxID=3040326 RepID=UPI0025570150|nr:thioredoxin domain-containing protein [Pseudarthrobacter sp. MEB009]